MGWGLIIDIKEGTFSRSIKLPGAIVTPVILGLPKLSDGDFSEL